MPKKRSREYRLGEFWLSEDPKSGYWCRTWYDAGRRQTRRASLGTADFHDAKELFEAWWIERRRPQDAKPADVQLAEIFMIYWQEHAEHVPSADQAKIALAHGTRFFGADSVHTAVRRCDEYVAKRRADGVTDRTISRELSVFNAAGNWCTEPAGVRQEPVLEAFRPFRPSKPLADTAEDKDPRGAPLTLDQVARALDAMRFKHLFRHTLLCLNTLCRPGAALDLVPDAHQVDLEHGLINLNPRGRRQTKKFRPVVPMTAAIRPWLATAQRAKDPYFVTYGKAAAGKGAADSGDGPQPVGSIKSGIRSLRAAAELPEDFNPYSWRHTMGRELRRAGVPHDQIAYMLGHRRLSTTDVYAPYDPNFMAAARDAIDAVMVKLDRLTDRSLLKPIEPVALDLRGKRGRRRA